MVDREKVIKGLERCSKHDGDECPHCPYFNGECTDDLMADALTLLKEQESVIEVLKSDLSETLDVVANRWNVVRCKECKKKGNSHLCRLDRDIEEHGCHRTDAYDDWFCADGVWKDGEQE